MVKINTGFWLYGADFSEWYQELAKNAFLIQAKQSVSLIILALSQDGKLHESGHNSGGDMN